MAQKVTVVLEDDLAGGPAEQTVRFAFDGTDYEIDLNAKNVAAFGKQLAPYLEHARRAGRAQPRRGRRTTAGRQRAGAIPRGGRALTQTTTPATPNLCAAPWHSAATTVRPADSGFAWAVAPLAAPATQRHRPLGGHERMIHRRYLDLTRQMGSFVLVAGGTNGQAGDVHLATVVINVQEMDRAIRFWTTALG